MGDNTTISWTHRPGTRARTWGPTQGCSLKSEGCRNCYAMRMAARFAENGWSKGLINLTTRKWNGVVRLATHKLAEPLSWKQPATVFVNSMSDLFHEELTNEEIAAVFGVMAACPHHTFQILTKRAAPGDADNTWWRPKLCLDIAGGYLEEVPPGGGRATWPLANVWLGVSVENQEAADERIPELLATPAAVRFLSCEPLLGPVDISEYFDPCSVPCGEEPWPELSWVIAGCESGLRARECQIPWLRSLRDQCETAHVPFFLKQAEESADCGDDRQLDIGDDDTVAFGDGSKLKRRRPGGNHVIELPYLDDVQHAAFPEVRDV